MKKMKKFLKSKYSNFLIDLILIIPICISSFILYIYHNLGSTSLRFSTKSFDFFGIFPIKNHYYQPLVFPRKHINIPLNSIRNLPSINLNIQTQFDLLTNFNFSKELLLLSKKNQNNDLFYYSNGAFEEGDSEMLFNIIRYFKPLKIIEIGSGFSTKMMLYALEKNKNVNTEVICIEPYQQKWLDSESRVKLIREKVENIPLSIFESLDNNDILFIDSSHIIRTQGDVLYEFLNILPILKKGVLIHIHDIYTPADYPDELVFEKRFLWNEQYLLEAFLSFNDHYEVICSLNYLKNNFFEKLLNACPNISKNINCQPASIWLRKIK
jgi:hypothetical protein